MSFDTQKALLTIDLREHDDFIEQLEYVADQHRVSVSQVMGLISNYLNSTYVPNDVPIAVHQDAVVCLLQSWRNDVAGQLQPGRHWTSTEEDQVEDYCYFNLIMNMASFIESFLPMDPRFLFEVKTVLQGDSCRLIYLTEGYR